MTEQNTTTPSLPGWDPRLEVPKKKQRRWFTKPVVILPVGALILGLGLGTMNRPAPERIAVPGPERIVTKTETVNVPTTPPECIKALDIYDQVVTLSGEAMGYMNDALQAAGRLDPAGITAASSKLNPLTEKTKALTDPLIAARTTCRAAG